MVGTISWVGGGVVQTLCDRIVNRLTAGVRVYSGDTIHLGCHLRQDMLRNLLNLLIGDAVDREFGTDALTD